MEKRRELVPIQRFQDLFCSTIFNPVPLLFALNLWGHKKSMKFSKVNTRMRGLASLALIAIIGAVFVTQFNQKNTEVSLLSSTSTASAKLGDTVNRIAKLAAKLQFETSNDGKSEKLIALEALKATLETDVAHFEAVTAALPDSIGSKVRLSAGFSADHLWPEKRILSRLDELAMIQQITERNAGANGKTLLSAWSYVDSIGEKQIINSFQPYAKPARLIAGPRDVIIAAGRHRQNLKINQLQSEASTDLKWITVYFVAAGLAMLAFIGLFIYWPLDKTINKQISELRASRKEVQNADRAKSEFLANMSHEIRTPMNGVMGMAELLTKTELDAKQRTFTDIIVKSGASLLTIINDILDFSKIDAGQMELDNAPFKLAEAIEDVATLVSSRVAEKDLELIVRVDPSLPSHLVGDVGRIRQIVTNLMGNAVKFTENGHVFVDVSGAELSGVKDSENRPIYALKFKIEDTGVGIPEEKCARVFDKFSQVDASATRKHEGTGLGLAISSSLVELMGGHIGVESEVNVGSTFWFTLELACHAVENKGRKMNMDISNARVLIIDDNENNRFIMSEMMTAWNFDSAAAVDGNEGIAVLKAAKQQGVNVDAVILDYHMPHMNGGDVVEAMRADPDLAEVPVVMLTSVEFTEEGKTFSSLGVQGHLTKPARSSLLLETLVQVITDDRAKRSEDENSFVAGIKHAQNIGGQKPSKTESKITEPKPSTTQVVSQETTKDGGLEILVCEDNEVNQIVFTQTLQEAGYDFKIASNGKMGIDYFKVYKPKLILMDVSMPEVNGLDATKAIRELEEGTDTHTPIIGVTAHAIKGDMERCIDAGMDDYLPKPISPDILVEKIGLLLNKSDKSSDESNDATSSNAA